MRIIRPTSPRISRYATLNRPHYICPECKIHIVRDRHEDMFMCMKCGRKETRSEFRQTLVANVAAAQEEERKVRETDARRERLQREIRDPAFKEQIGVVYYIRFQDYIKIGTSTDISVRLSGFPWDYLALTEPGSHNVERERHTQFADLRHSGEWFSAEPPLLDFIEKRRNELEAPNRKRYGHRPPLPWAKGEVRLPTVYEVLENIHDEIRWSDAILVEEMEDSSIYFTNDQKDFVD